jgi:two-component system, NtrC family, response regulator AtoC
MTNPRRILVVDDEPKMRRLLELTLQGMGHRAVQAPDGIDALELLAAEPCDLVLTDMRMPRLDGLGLLRAMRERGIETPVVMLTAHGTVESAVEAMKLGAVDYILRPFEMSTVELAVTRALAIGEVQRENRFLRDEVGRGWGEFIGQGEAMTRLYALVRQVAVARSSVFIVGETGTGKELVARAIHQQSGRTGLFVPYNCAAIPAELLEGELFGSRKGAFTGADRDRVGRFEASSGGTIFLDEITEMPVGLQGKLLRVLQEGVVERLGTQVPIALDLRVVAATNRDPALAMAEGRLRADLYYRLNVVRVDVPPLRERREDIPLLAEHFLARYSRELGRHPPRLAAETLALLGTYAWPGNVREVQNLMERAAVLARGSTITPDQLPPELLDAPPQPAGAEVPADASGDTLVLQPQVDALEWRLIRDALRRTGDNKSAAARLLEISERSLWYKLKKYGG